MVVDGVPNVRTCITPSGMYGHRKATWCRKWGKNMINVPLVVIGAGPAGLSAAIEAAKAGVKYLY